MSRFLQIVKWSGLLGLTMVLSAVADEPKQPSVASLRVTTSPSDPRQVEVVLAMPRATARQLKAALDSLQLQLVNEDEQHQVKLGSAIFAAKQIKGQTITLVPRFRLTPSATYRASAVIDQGEERRVITQFQVADLSAPRPRVVGIRPSGKVPANCLKFYVYFSQPMREGKEIFERIKIVDQLGAPIVDPWRRVELWSADAKRLTLWIHPGRIKKGVNLREEFGPVLQPGRKYALVIDASTRSALGTELGEDFRHLLETTAEDHQRPDPARWELNLPATADGWLEVQFDEALDHAQLPRFIKLYRDDKQIDAEVDTGRENRLLLKPKTPWQNGDYQLRVHPRLEDLAGNTPERVFDRDLAAPAAGKNDPVRAFRIRLD